MMFVIGNGQPIKKRSSKEDLDGRDSNLSTID